MKCPYRITTKFSCRVEHGNRNSALVGGTHYFAQQPCCKKDADTITQDFEDCIEHECACYQPMKNSSLCRCVKSGRSE